jgi:hypothetical protein
VGKTPLGQSGSRSLRSLYFVAFLKVTRDLNGSFQTASRARFSEKTGTADRITAELLALYKTKA